MNIVKHRRIFYWISGVVVGGSIISMILFGFNLGIDFKGGSILEVEYVGERPPTNVVEEVLEPLDVGASVRSTGEKGYLIRMRSLTEPERVSVINVLSIDETTQFEQKRFDSIGPLLGKEAAKKALVSIILVILAIIVFIAFAFRKVSEPVSSWKYGLIAITALLHDVIIPTGIFSILGHYLGYEIDTLFITALLVILGFSVHDTIVVFDRVREKLNFNNKRNFDELVGESIRETFTRSINTSLTVILSLIALYFIGGEAIQPFTLALLIGIIAGTYSSIFLASPLLVTLEKMPSKK